MKAHAVNKILKHYKNRSIMSVLSLVKIIILFLLIVSIMIKELLEHVCR